MRERDIGAERVKWKGVLLFVLETASTLRHRPSSEDPPLPRQPRVLEVPRPAGSLRSVAPWCCTVYRSAGEHEQQEDKLGDTGFETLATRPRRM